MELVTNNVASQALCVHITFRMISFADLLQLCCVCTVAFCIRFIFAHGLQMLWQFQFVYGWMHFQICALFELEVNVVLADICLFPEAMLFVCFQLFEVEIFVCFPVACL